ncbi:MAG: hypothetical protein FDZ72_00610 [Betaproteobacteria bacterium]|nr:MAG: hypothetical protein FDZ72_00610 [Betaproteobacteria bacterium]
MPSEIAALPASNLASQTNGPRETAPPMKFEEVRQQQNKEILQASLEVSIQAGNDSQTLLLRTAIDSINETLGGSADSEYLQKAAAEQDNSPEATADRILSFSTALYAAYAANHPDGNPDQVAQDFVSLIRGGFEKGFNEARDILKGLNVLSGDVEVGIGRTYQLVQKGLDDFLGQLVTPKQDATSTDGAGTSTAAPAASTGTTTATSKSSDTGTTT